MYLTNKTNYGFRADGLGIFIEDFEHLILREHTYYLKDKTEDDKEYTLGTCTVKEIRGLYDLEAYEVSGFADADSDEFIEALSEVLHNKDIDFYLLTQVIFISRLELDKLYRGQGKGKLFLNQVMKDVTFDNSSIVLLEPFPINDEVKEEDRKAYTKKYMPKIKKFYKDLKFKPINKNSKYMYKCV